MNQNNPERTREIKAALKQRGNKWRRVGALFTVWLVAVWIMVFGDFSPLSLLGALLVAVAVQVLFPLPHHQGIWQVHPVQLVSLLAHFLGDLIRAGIHVSWLVISGRPHQDAILRCSIRSVNPVYVTILVALTSLIPGTIVVQVDRVRGVIYLHCLDVVASGGADGIRRATAAQEARILRAVAPRAVLEQVGLGSFAGKKDQGGPRV